MALCGLKSTHKIKLKSLSIWIITREEGVMDGAVYITDRDGNLNVFNLNSEGDKLKLNTNNARPDNRWNSNNQFLFCSRKLVLFLARLTLSCRVFLFWVFQTFPPTAKHSAYFFQFLAYFLILFV
jgi:hypothetical protein